MSESTKEEVNASFEIFRRAAAEILQHGDTVHPENLQNKSRKWLIKEVIRLRALALKQAQITAQTTRQVK